jgi:hypothetical protein
MRSCSRSLSCRIERKIEVARVLKLSTLWMREPMSVGLLVMTCPRILNEVCLTPSLSSQLGKFPLCSELCSF